MFRILAAAVLLALGGTAHGTNVNNVNSVMMCPSNIYADGSSRRHPLLHACCQPQLY